MASAAPAGRAKSIDDDLANQLDAIEDAKRSIAAPAPDAQPRPAAEVARQKKAAPKRIIERADPFNR